MNRVNEKYSYISHPQSFPLELKGTSKRKASADNFNSNKPQLNNEGKSLLLKKLQNNVHNFSNTKSVIPVDLNRTAPRKQSIKVYPKNQNHCSGVNYLMNKNTQFKQHERMHLHEMVPTNLPKTGQKKHFATIQYLAQQRSQIKHKQTNETKIRQDILSNPYRVEKQKVNNKKKYESQNLFKCAEDLGLQKVRQPKVSDSKMIEMVGSEHIKNSKTDTIKQRRDEWRISNINFF